MSQQQHTQQTEEQTLTVETTETEKKKSNEEDGLLTFKIGSISLSVKETTLSTIESAVMKGGDPVKGGNGNEALEEKMMKVETIFAETVTTLLSGAEAEDAKEGGQPTSNGAAQSAPRSKKINYPLAASIIAGVYAILGALAVIFFLNGSYYLAAVHSIVCASVILAQISGQACIYWIFKAYSLLVILSLALAEYLLLHDGDEIITATGGRKWLATLQYGAILIAQKFSFVATRMAYNSVTGAHGE